MAFDYVAEADIARLVQSRVLMPATADRCTVPAEVARAAPQSMLSLIAFGGESNFSQPRPAAAPADLEARMDGEAEDQVDPHGHARDDHAGHGRRRRGREPERPRTKKEKLRGARKIWGSNRLPAKPGPRARYCGQ